MSFEDRANTVSAMEVGEGLADRLAEHAKERRLGRVDGHQLQAFLAKRRRHFRADEPHAHDDDAAAGHDLFPNVIGVLDRAKAVDAFEMATRNRDAPVAPAGGNEQRVERHLTVVLELHEAC